MRLCNGRILSLRWGKYAFGCPVNQRTLISPALHTHRVRGVHPVTRFDGHKRTTRAEFFLAHK